MEPLSKTAREFLAQAQRGEAPTVLDRERVRQLLFDSLPLATSHAAEVGKRAASSIPSGTADGGLRSFIAKSIPLPHAFAMMLAVFGAGIAVGHSSSSKAPARPEASPVSVAPTDAPTVDLAPVAPPASLTPTPMPTPAPPRPVPPTPRVTIVTAIPGSASTVADEAATILHAKRELELGHPASALEALETHERAHPHGTLSEERDALRIVALCALNRTEGAEERARFLRARPLSPYLDRVRDACSGALPP